MTGTDLCPQCNSILDASDRFCGNCGTQTRSPSADAGLPNHQEPLDKQQVKRRRQGRRELQRWLALAVAALVIAVAGLIWTERGNPNAETPTNGAGTAARSSVTGDPRFLEAVEAAASSQATDSPDLLPLPSPGTQVIEETREYLSGPGAPILSFLSLTEGSWNPAPLDESACKGLISSLESAEGPAELAALAGVLTDEPARDLIVNLVALMVDLVSSCGSDEGAVADVAWHWAVTYRRLAELGVDVP